MNEKDIEAKIKRGGMPTREEALWLCDAVRQYRENSLYYADKVVNLERQLDDVRANLNDGYEDQ